MLTLYLYSLASNVQYRAEDTVMFPEEKAAAQEKLVLKLLTTRYQAVMNHFPSMTGVFTDLDQYVNTLSVKTKKSSLSTGSLAVVYFLGAKSQPMLPLRIPVK